MQHTSPKDVQRLSTRYTHPIYFSVRKEKVKVPRCPFRKRMLLVISRLNDDKDHRNDCLLNKPTNHTYPIVNFE